jgi:hypothetical protein
MRSQSGVVTPAAKAVESTTTQAEVNGNSTSNRLRVSPTKKKVPAALQGKLKLELEQSQNDDIAREKAIDESEEPQRKKRRLEPVKSATSSAATSQRRSIGGSSSADARFMHIGEKYSPGNGQRDYELSMYDE